MERYHSVIFTLLMLDASRWKDVIQLFLLYYCWMQVGGKMSFSYFDFSNAGCK